MSSINKDSTETIQIVEPLLEYNPNSIPAPSPILFQQFGFDYSYCAKNMCIVFKHIFIVLPPQHIYMKNIPEMHIPACACT